MTPHYTHYFADAGHSGCIHAQPAGNLAPAWTAAIEPPDPRPRSARLVLTADQQIIVDAGDTLCAYNLDGAPLWQRPKWPGSPVVLKNRLLCFAGPERKDRMTAVDLNNQVQLQDVVFPEHGEGSYATLFEPTPQGIVAQIQYAAIPEMRAPNFILYCSDPESYGYRWSRRFTDQLGPMVPVINRPMKQVVTATREQVLCFGQEDNPEAPDPQSAFAMPLGGKAHWVSAGPDGMLYFAGFSKARAHLEIMQPDGDTTGRWLSDAGAGDRMMPVAPPVIGPGLVYVVCRGAIMALAHDRLVWQKPADPGAYIFATALADGSLLAVAAPNHLLHIGPAGDTITSAATENPISAPPVCGINGRVIVGAGDRLHAFG